MTHPKSIEHDRASCSKNSHKRTAKSSIILFVLASSCRFRQGFLLTSSGHRSPEVVHTPHSSFPVYTSRSPMHAPYATALSEYSLPHYLPLGTCISSLRHVRTSPMICHFKLIFINICKKIYIFLDFFLCQSVLN